MTILSKQSRDDCAVLCTANNQILAKPRRNLSNRISDQWCQWRSVVAGIDPRSSALIRGKTGFGCGSATLWLRFVVFLCAPSWP